MLQKEKFLFIGHRFPIMGKYPISVCVLFLLSSFVNAQVTNISGIVNTYTAVIEIIPAKACVRVSDVTGLVNSESVMLIQMKGASVQTGNNANFGDTTSLNNAGNYEMNTICGIKGDSVFLFYSLLNNYAVPGKVQLVGVPTYYSAVVTDTLKAGPWNNNTGTGGVLAIKVDETLTLNAPVFADNLGFKGGAYMVSNGTCSNLTPATGYIYDANSLNPQNGAFKGESVFDVSAAQSGGRGAVASGGGGGNNHNNGGGGGANLSVGGDGGGNSSSTGCTNNLKGLKGKALASWNGTKIFFGGGGGAGHSNLNSTPSGGGGNGGGIIFLKVNNLISNNQRITANGGTGGPALSDGASGGGGGGTIIADIQNYSGTLTVQANGGTGGVEDDGLNIKRCYGAGGGGSGGAIYFSGNLPTASITTAAGTAGPENGRDPACNAIVAASAGTNGFSFVNYSYRSSVIPGNYCNALPLSIHLLFFKATINNNKVLLQWKISEPKNGQAFIVERKSSTGNWRPVAPVLESNNSLDYQLIDIEPMSGLSYYRLKIVGNDGSISYSPVQQIEMFSTDETIRIFPNPAKDQVLIRGNLPSDAMIRLISAEGKLVLYQRTSTNRQDMQLALPNLAPGIYILQINALVKKLIIR